MISPSTLMAGAVWVSLGMAMLMWAMLCAATANWGAKRGAEFRKTILISFLLTPIAGLLYARFCRRAHPRGALA